MIRLIDLTYYQTANVRKPLADISIGAQEQIITLTGISKQASLRKDAVFVVLVSAFLNFSPRLGSAFLAPWLRGLALVAFTPYLHVYS